MNLRKLKKLIDLVQESGISELEVTEGEEKVRIAKHSTGPAPISYAPQAPVAQPVAAAPVAAAAPAEPALPDGHEVKSPMVGTFYRSSSPGAKPFADIGDTVKVGQAVCIIEAMKIMNEIESDAEGKVVRILCENGQAVEFGQPLFVLE